MKLPKLERNYRARVAQKWAQFYSEVLSMNVSLADVLPPKRPSGVDVPLIHLAFHSGICDRFGGYPIDGLFELSRECFGKGHKFTDESLDEFVSRHAREFGQTSYSLWTPNRIEVQGQGPMSAVGWRCDGSTIRNSMTLPERLFQGLYFWWKSKGKKLDVKRITICDGSWTGDGKIPCVDFDHAIGVNVTFITPDMKLAGSPRQVWT